MAVVAKTAESKATIGTLLRDAANGLADVTDAPRIEAEALLVGICGLSRTEIFAHPERSLADEPVARFIAALRRRQTGEPSAYIVGTREFYSLSFSVGPAVLIPRPETEFVVDVAIAFAGDGRCRILDLGTGSGAIALAIKHECPNADVTGVDVDPSALAIAERNGAELGLDVRFVASDWLKELRGERFDVIVSNPPYVRSGDPHFCGPLAFEPRGALDGGPDGLDSYRTILQSVRPHLFGHSQLVFEHGFDQREALGALASDYGFTVAEARKDLSGQPRVLVLRAGAEE